MPHATSIKGFQENITSFSIENEVQETNQRAMSMGYSLDRVKTPLCLKETQ